VAPPGSETAQRSVLRDEGALPPLDVLSDAFQRDPLGTLREARSRDRFAFSRRGVEVLRYDDVASLIVDERLDTQDASVYARMGGPASLVTFADDGLLVAMRGEKHGRIRRVFSAGFRVRQVEAQRDLMRATAQELLAAWPSDSCEFVSDFSNPYPMHVLCRLLGVPVADVPMFSHAATELHLLAAVPLDPGFPRIDAALRVLFDYITELIHERRERPRADIISSLISVQATEGRLSDTELAYNLVNLIFAGQDTTRYQLASAVTLLTQTPGVWSRLAADDGLVPAAVEECMRLSPVTRFVIRIPHEDITIGDVAVRAGRRVVLNLLSASRDENRFADPDRLLLPRPGPGFDVPFGWGMHYCLGAALARVEMQEAIRLLVEQFEPPVAGDGAEYTAPAGMLHGPERLPLLLRRRSA
jgi:cytochrome P450